MTSLKAVVRNGRLVLDVPTQLPEGTEIELAPIIEHPPESTYEPVSLRELELVEHDLGTVPSRPTGPPALEESSFFISPRAPARSVIARRHLTTVSEKWLKPMEGTELASKIRDANARAAKHLRSLEGQPEGDNYLSNAKGALACARESLSLLQGAAEKRPELVPAASEAAEAVGMIFSLLS